MRGEALAGLIQVDNCFAGFYAPCNMLSGGQAECYADQHFFGRRYFKTHFTGASSKSLIQVVPYRFRTKSKLNEVSL